MKWLLFIILFQIPTFAVAAPAKFTVQTTGSGYFNFVPFTDLSITITGYGDTANRRPSVWGTGLHIIHDSATVSVGSLGEFAITMPTKTFVNNGTSTVGFGNGYQYGTDLFNGPTNDAFTTWDLGSSLGPITGRGYNLLTLSSQILTSGGYLYFYNSPTTVTFTATVVPEPSTLILVGCLLPLAFRRQR